MGIGVLIAQEKENILLKKCKKLQNQEGGNVYQYLIRILIQLFIGNAIKGMNGLQHLVQ